MQGIIMQGPSVLATLAGNKTQTRQLIKEQPPEGWDKVEYVNNDREVWFSPSGYIVFNISTMQRESFVVKIPHPVGAVRYVKEAYWARKPVPYGGWELYYKADAPLEIQNELKQVSHNINNALFMPEKHSRLHIKITEVRVERVQDISDDDVMSEGCLTAPEFINDDGQKIPPEYKLIGGAWRKTKSEAFASYFGQKAWESNPWVFVYDYEVIWRKQ